MIDVIVTQRVKPGMEQEFERITRELTANTLSKDQGCLRYEWYRAEAPQTYILIEQWTDMAAVQAHLASEHMASLKPEYQECVPEGFSVTRLSRLD
jgi:quinol monooxygenase YgiN